MPSEMELICVFTGKGILHFVSDIKVFNTDLEKLKFSLKLLLCRSIFKCQTQGKARGSSAFRQLAQDAESFNSNSGETDRKKKKESSARS